MEIPPLRKAHHICHQSNEHHSNAFNKETRDVAMKAINRPSFALSSQRFIKACHINFLRTVNEDVANSA